jgi:uncharacterized protein (DUF488 family)
MRRIKIKRARTWHYRKMPPCIEPSNDLAPWSPFRSWLGCITNTSGYDFRKGQHPKSMTPNPFYTIGHSTTPIGAFVDVLKAAKINYVVDVRSISRSRTNPQYNADLLSPSLSKFQIGYAHIAELGGRRGRQGDVAPSTNGFWENQSFHNYADYAMSPEFHSGLSQRNLGHKKHCVIMCAEAVWWRCHRRIIADYLMAAGEKVFHILGKNHIDEAQLTSAARSRSDATLVYPADA